LFDRANLNLLAYCGYPTWTREQHDHRPEDWLGRYVVKAAKRDMEALQKGYVVTGQPPVKYNDKNYQLLVDRAAAWLGDQVKGLNTPVVLVAIPNSQATKEATDFGTKRLVELVARHAGANCTPYSGLRFIVPQPPSHDGGSRDKAAIQRNLTLTASIPPGRIVLFDDVCTSGAHLFAAQRLLRPRPADLAITFGRTFGAPPAKMIELGPEELSTFW